MPLWAWILFYALVLLMLVVDLKMFGKKGQHEVNVKEALRMTGVWIGVSMLFAIGIYFFYPVMPHDKAMEFLAGAWSLIQHLQCEGRIHLSTCFSHKLMTYHLFI